MFLKEFVEQHEDELDFNLSVDEMDLLIGSVFNKWEQRTLNKHVDGRSKEIAEKIRKIFYNLKRRKIR